jgi:P-type Ca2+ transporter type 2C
MITGDYPQTARAIARGAGIADGALLTGADIDALDDPALRRAARSATVFARIRPNQKLRIVEALKADGEVVAMTGDGVNDAPALKAAHIVRAVRLGRRIYDNLRKAFAYILAIHIPIAGLALVPIVLGHPLLLTPMLIALLELIIDPACSIVLEAEREEGNIMKRPPRHPRSPLISRALVGWSVFQGGAALFVVCLLYALAVRRGLPAAEVRAFALVSLVGVNLALILSTRTFGASLFASFRRYNASLVWALSIVAGVLAILMAWPTLRSFCGLGPIAGADVLLSALAAVALLLLLGGMRRLWGTRLAV